eukprot:5857076-Pleurochrysis_carterae.AAC.1
MQPTLANTPGLAGCSTPAPAVAMLTTPTPTSTRVTRTADGNGGRPPANATGRCDALNPSPCTLTPTPLSLPCTCLQSRAVAGGTPDEAAGSAPVVDDQCDQRPSTPQHRWKRRNMADSCAEYVLLTWANLHATVHQCTMAPFYE